MKIVKLKCDSCGAVLEVNEELKNVTCNYCGSSFIIDDGVKRVEINKNIKYTDEAKLKENDTKLKELDYKYRDNKLKMFLDLFKNDNFSAILLFIFMGVIGISFSFLLNLMMMRLLFQCRQKNIREKIISKLFSN